MRRDHVLEDIEEELNRDVMSYLDEVDSDETISSKERKFIRRHVVRAEH